MCGIISGFYRPTDSFIDVVRKMTMVIACYTGISGITISIPFSIMDLLENPSAANVLYLCYAIVLATGVIHFAYARKHRTATNNQMLALMSMGATAVTLNTFARPENFGHFHSFLIALIAWLMDLKPRLPFLVWAIVVNCIVMWNKSLMETRDPADLEWMLVAPGVVLGGSVWWRLSDWVIAWGAFAGITIAAINFQVNAYKHSIRGANFSNEVVNLMLEKIKTFDIDSAREVLAESEKEIDETTKEKVLNPEFGQILGSLCDQLDSYRPYLPNWLLEMENDAESGDQAGGGDEEGDLSEIDSDATPSDHDSTQPANCTPKGIGGITPRQAAYEDNESAASSKNSAHSVKLTADPTKSVVKTQRKITLCVLDFEPKRGKLRKEPAYLEMVQALIDAVAKAAKTTHASIHGTTGDQIVATWNASLNTAQPELKACQFLCQVKAQVREYHRDTYDSLGFSGAAKTGLAWCHHVVSTTGSKSSNFMIHYLWRSALEAMCRHARAFGTLLVDEQTFELGQLRVEGWLVDALKLDRELLPSGERVESYSSVVDPQRQQSPPHLLNSRHDTVNSFDGNTSPPLRTPSENNSLANTVTLDLPGPGATRILIDPSKVMERHKDAKDSVMLCYELLKEKSLAEDEWLYQLEEAAAAPHENVSALAKRLWCSAPANSPNPSATEGTTPRQTHESIPSMVAKVQEAVDSGKVTNTLLLHRFYQHAQASVTAWTEDGPQYTAVRKGNRHSQASSCVSTPGISSLQATSLQAVSPQPDVHLS